MKKQNTNVRKEQIKRAVLEIISSQGPGNVSTRNLARHVGISEGAIFRHFKSKQDIIFSIIEDVKKNMVESMYKAASQDKPADERLFEIMCIQVKYILKNEGINILLFSEATHYNDTVLKREMHSILESQKKIFTDIIKSGISEGLWSDSIDVEDVVMLYMGIPISLNIELVLNRKGVKTESFCKRMFALFSRILLKMSDE